MNAPGLRYLIVGTGRCGTGSAAFSLNAAGLRCGHENVFTPEGIAPVAGWLGDASWLAVPHLSGFEGHIQHLVREPVATAQSFLDLGFFDADFDNPFSRFARRYVPLTGKPVDDAFRWYLHWNQACEAHAHIRRRLDEMDALVGDIARAVGAPEPAAEVLAEARAAWRNTKPLSKTRRHMAGYDRIADPGLADEVRAMAARYGF